jgi:hypothetical protein
LCFGGLDASDRGEIVLHRIVEILLSGGLLLREWSVALDVKLRAALHGLGVGKLRLGLRQLTFRLIEHRMKWPWVDLEKELSFPNECSLLIALLEQVPAHLCPDIGIDQAIERANPFSKDRNILLLDRRHLNVGNTSRLRGLRMPVWANRSDDQPNCDDGDNYAAPDVALRHVHIHLHRGCLLISPRRYGQMRLGQKSGDESIRRWS